MRAIQIDNWGAKPEFTDSAPSPAKPSDGSSVQVKVLASGLSGLVKLQTTGKHYSTANASLPYIPGADGVGLTTDGNKFVYFECSNAGGGYAKYITVPSTAIYPIPTPAGISAEEQQKLAIKIAGLFNPCMSSWMALRTRTSGLKPGFTVFILGATSLSGSIAITLSRALGASKVIGAARNVSKLEKLGLDHIVELKDDAKTTDFSIVKQFNVDVILDYVYGDACAHLLDSLPADPTKAHEMATQYLQIGSLGGSEVSMVPTLLRSKNLTMRGSGPGSWSVTKNASDEFPGLLGKLVDGTVGNFPLKEVKFEDVESAWKDRARIVFVS